MAAKNTGKENESGGLMDVGEAARASMGLMRQCKVAALACLDMEGGGRPFISKIGVAIKADGAPIMLLSDISRHTQYLAADHRAALLFESAVSHDNPLTAARVSLNGSVRRCREGGELDEARSQYMQMHPKAFYADFPDFAFYVMETEHVHYVGGFAAALSFPAEHLRHAGREERRS